MGGWGGGAVNLRGGNEHQCTGAHVNTEARSTAGRLVSLEKGIPLESPSASFKIFFRKRRGVGDKEETKIENTRFPTCLQHRRTQLGEVKGEDALLVLVAVAPVTVKPVGGAIELWLGCRSLGMPL